MDAHLLSFLSELTSNIIIRKQKTNLIESMNQEILSINEGLEKLVDEKTSKNAELSQMLTNQDKFAMIGEISAGIAHDLNTPLGAIKSSTENIRHTLHSLFEKSITKMNANQLDKACQLALKKNYSLFIGGLDMLRETKKWKEILSLEFNVPDNEIDNLANAFCRARVDIQDNDLINHILSQENKSHYLNLIYDLRAISVFLDIIMDSVDRSSGVVDSLRYFMAQNKSIQKEEVNLFESIETVLRILNFELKHGIIVHLDVDSNIVLSGYKSKLYQVWANIVKNAVDAMNKKGNIFIHAHVEDNVCTVSIANDGPEIPKESIPLIFNKYFTSKDEYMGTGLGLSIVKEIIDEHNAKIQVESNDESTNFIIKFNL